MLQGTDKTKKVKQKQKQATNNKRDPQKEAPPWNGQKNNYWRVVRKKNQKS